MTNIVDEVYRAAGRTPLSELSPALKRAKIAEIEDELRQDPGGEDDLDYVRVVRISRRLEALTHLFDECALYVGPPHEERLVWEREDEGGLGLFDPEIMSNPTEIDVRRASEVMNFGRKYARCLDRWIGVDARLLEFLNNREQPSRWQLILGLIIKYRPSREAIRYFRDMLDDKPMSIILMTIYLWKHGKNTDWGRDAHAVIYPSLIDERRPLMFMRFEVDDIQPPDRPVYNRNAVDTIARSLSHFWHEYLRCDIRDDNGELPELTRYLIREPVTRTDQLLQLIAMMILKNRPSWRSVNKAIAAMRNGGLAIIELVTFLFAIFRLYDDAETVRTLRFLGQLLVDDATAGIESTIYQVGDTVAEYREMRINHLAAEYRDEVGRANRGVRGYAYHYENYTDSIFRPAVNSELMLFYYYADACPLIPLPQVHVLPSKHDFGAFARLGYLVPRDIVIYTMQNFDQQVRDVRYNLDNDTWYDLYRHQFVKLYDALMDPANQRPPPVRRRSAIQAERRVRPRHR